MRRLHVEHHDRDEDRQHAITKGFHSFFGHWIYVSGLIVQSLNFLALCRLRTRDRQLSVQVGQRQP